MTFQGDSDSIRLKGTLGITALIVVGSFVLIGILVYRGDIRGDSLLPFLSGLLAGAATWLFAAESTKSGARTAERNVNVGAAAATSAQPTVTTTTSGQPPSTTVTSTPSSEPVVIGKDTEGGD